MILTPYTCRQITDDLSLQLFSDKYYDASNFRVELDYLRKAYVYQFYKNENPVAGFVLNDGNKSPLRYFHFFDKSLKDKILEHNEDNVLDNNVLEITCNFKDRTGGVILEMYYYAKLFWYAKKIASALDKKFLLGGSIKKKIKWTQNDVMRHTLFHGPLVHKELDPNGELEMLEIYYCYRNEMWYNVLKTGVKKYIFKLK